MDFVTLSHLRWNFVFQRPQHLMSRCAKADRVFFWEEPVFDAPGTSFLEVQQPSSHLHVVVPHLPSGLSEAQMFCIQEWLLTELLNDHSIQPPSTAAGNCVRLHGRVIRISRSAIWIAHC
jgi:UDP-galactopyranose mutase